MIVIYIFKVYWRYLNVVNILLMKLNKAHRVLTGREIVGLLVKSQKIFNEISNNLKNHKMNIPSLSLYFRSWIPNIHYGWEFRAFLRGGMVTAITHFNSHNFYNNNFPSYIPDLLTNRDQIQNAFSQFFTMAQLHKRFDSSYSIDLAVIPGSFEIYVIDVNPFPPICTSVLYNYHNMEDRRSLESGPFQTRYQEVYSKKIFIR